MHLENTSLAKETLAWRKKMIMEWPIRLMPYCKNLRDNPPIGGAIPVENLPECKTHPNEFDWRNGPESCLVPMTFKRTIVKDMKTGECFDVWLRIV